MELQSQFVEVNDVRMHFVEAGKGNPIVFLHGMPASSYLWRNIIPPLSDKGRCIAIDLIGMGQSDKPDIEYRVFDHIRYVDAVLDNLKLKKVTLVMHGWGSVIGFDYARRHPDKIKGMAFFEAHVRPATDWNMLSLPVQQLASMLEHPEGAYKAVVEQNYFIKRLLPSSTLRRLTEEETEQYCAPFATPASRKLLWQYLQDLPLGDGPADVIELIAGYSKWLEETDIPKLMLYAVPGFITTIDTVQWARDHLKNLTLVDLGDAMHFAQESEPEVFSEKLREWYLSL